MNKIFISGPMTGTDDYETRFKWAEKYLLETYDCIVINPTMPLGYTYKEYIDMALDKLKYCTAIYMLNGWEKSNGARLEHTYAVATGLKIIYENC